MSERYAGLVRRLREAVLTSSGATEPSLRAAIEARSATIGGRPRPTTGAVPFALQPYVEQVARHAYRVTDEDVDALRRAGYSEDAIFETTASAALGPDRVGSSAGSLPLSPHASTSAPSERERTARSRRSRWVMKSWSKPS